MTASRLLRWVNEGLTSNFLTMGILLQTLSILPLLPPFYILYHVLSHDKIIESSTDASSSSVGAQLLLFLALGILGHLVTHRLIPSIKYYMLKRGICGRDLGKKGTNTEDDDM